MEEQQKKILSHWSAYIYEQQEDEEDIVRCMRRLIGDEPRNILEVACGGGKLCVPLARAGHHVTGMDHDPAMLHYAQKKGADLPGLRLILGDMLTVPWHGGYDVVILGTNLLLNIETDWDYRQAQKQLIQRAADALKPGGMLILDFDCPDDLSPYAGDGEWLCFEGTDDQGTFGRYFVCGGSVNPRSRTVKSLRRYAITPKEGQPFTVTRQSVKHFPLLEEVCGWLYRAGFVVQSLGGGHHNQPFDEEHRRAVICARKD